MNIYHLGANKTQLVTRTHNYLFWHNYLVCGHHTKPFICEYVKNPEVTKIQVEYLGLTSSIALRDKIDSGDVLILDASKLTDI